MSLVGFSKISGLALIVAGVAYIVDTAVEAIAPSASPGLGVIVPALSLVGFPAFWMSLPKPPSGPFADVVFATGILGIAGLAPVTFLMNRVFPEMPPEAVMALLGSIQTELIVIGVTFLLSALLLFALAWRSDRLTRIGAGIYALGAIPVSLPPLMPPALVEVGGVMVASAMLIWGFRLLTVPAGVSSAIERARA